MEIVADYLLLFRGKDGRIFLQMANDGFLPFAIFMCCFMECNMYYNLSEALWGFYGVPVLKVDNGIFSIIGGERIFTFQVTHSIFGDKLMVCGGLSQKEQGMFNRFLDFSIEVEFHD